MGVNGGFGRLGGVSCCFRDGFLVSFDGDVDGVADGVSFKFLVLSDADGGFFVFGLEGVCVFVVFFGFAGGVAYSGYSHVHYGRPPFFLYCWWLGLVLLSGDWHVDEVFVFHEFLVAAVEADGAVYDFFHVAEGEEHDSAFGFGEECFVDFVDAEVFAVEEPVLADGDEADAFDGYVSDEVVVVEGVEAYDVGFGEDVEGESSFFDDEYVLFFFEDDDAGFFAVGAGVGDVYLESVFVYFLLFGEDLDAAVSDDASEGDAGVSFIAAEDEVLEVVGFVADACLDEFFFVDVGDVDFLFFEE